MIYLLLFFEFFKIGLFAIGGGAATIPFLFDLSEKYHWFSFEELTNMIAVAESTPGPIGVNMATFAGFQTAGIFGAIIATLGLVTPSLIIIIMVAKLLKCYAQNPNVQIVLGAIRPAVLALILFALMQIAKISLNTSLSISVFFMLTILMLKYKKHPILYIVLSALIGVILKL
ncbi:MAG: chromate transporter [Alphaproteobacteria bacterium]|nr:chromate transporter [Alphaproteobacteria bacterium]